MPVDSSPPPGATALSAVAAALGLSVREDLPVFGVCLDSRQVRPGDLYAALPGEHTHGARFAEAAIRAGAAAMLTDPEGQAIVGSVPLPVLVVAHPRAELGRIASLIYGNQPPGLRVIGVTGTNGKTTTAYLIDSALRALGERTGLVGTVEIRIADDRVPSARTTPEAPDLHALIAAMRQAEVDTCVMEVSSHALRLHRVDGLVCDLALFTNLSQDHLDFHADMEDYFQAKAALFTPERAKEGIVVVDHEYGRRLLAQASIPMTSIGAVDADYRIERDGASTQAFRLHGPDGTADLHSALPGDFNVTNTAMAAVALVRCGYSLAEAARAVLADPQVPGRMERVQSDGIPPGRLLGVVDYAHTPDAVSAALRALRQQTPGLLVVVIGAGGDRDRGKRDAMGRAAGEAADLVVVTDDNPRTEDPASIRSAVAAGARAVGRAEVLEVAGRRAAIEAAVNRAWSAAEGATIAVVGKGHETGQEIGGVVHPFDDREQLLAALTAAAKNGTT